MRNERGKNSRLKDLRMMLDQYGFLSSKLEPSSIPAFQEITELFFSKINKDENQIQPNVLVAGRLSDFIKMVTDSYENITLSFIVKKIAILHTFMNKAVVQRHYSATIEQYIQEEVNRILSSDVGRVFLSKKRQGSLTKMMEYIRDLSSSKEKREKREGKMVIEKHSQKGAVKEIIKKVIQPFSLYLLKITQDNEAYSFLSTPRSKANSLYLWKAINWSRLLCDIIIELNRLCRYFRDDLTGVWVFLAYLISVDISKYYECLRQHIECQSIFWCNFIRQMVCNEKDSKYRESSDILESTQFFELSRYIQEMTLIREKMNYIFINKELKKWRMYFVIPSCYRADTLAHSEELNYVIDFIEASKVKGNNRKTESLKAKVNPEEAEMFISFESELSRTLESVSAVTENKLTELRDSEADGKKDKIFVDVSGTEPSLHLYKKYSVQPRKASFITQTKSRRSFDP